MPLNSMGLPTSMFPALYNPNSYKITKAVEYDVEPVFGLDSPYIAYKNGGARKLSMELFFDIQSPLLQMAGGAIDVRMYLEMLRQMQEIDSDTHKPPKLMVTWGSMIFVGFLTQVDENYTRFSSFGLPIRATVNVEFLGYEAITELLKKASKQSADRTKERLLIEGEQLWALSQTEYENPEWWRKIAVENNIDNPRKLRWGHKITVPSIEVD